MVTRSKCNICNTLPARINGQCQQCHSKITKIQNESRTPEPVKFLTYRGMVIGLYPSKVKGMLTPQPVTRSADSLPQAKTIDLNVYCEGFDRETIKRFKSAVLSIAGAHPSYAKNKK